GSQATHLYMQSDIAQYLPKDDPTIKLLTQVYEDFQIGSSIIILVEADDIRNPAALKEMDAVVSNDDVDKYPNDNGQLDGIVSVQSLASYIKEENFYRGTGQYKIPDDENLIYTFMGRLTIEKLKGIIYKDDYKLGVIVIQLADNASYDEILARTKKSVERRGNDDTLMSVTGSIAVQRAMRDKTFYYLKIVIPIAVLFIAVVLFVLHRSVKGLFIGFLPLLYAIALTFGIQGMVQPEMNLLSIAVIALLLGLGIDYSIYLVNRYAEEHAIKDKVERVEKTLSSTGKAVFLCAFTTIFAFGSLMTSSMPPIATFGFECALGISFTFTSAFILVPCLCIILNFEKHKENHRWKHFACIIVNHRKRLFMLACFFVVISLIMVPQIKTDVNYFEMAPKDIPEIDALYKYSRNLGGSTNFNAIVVETESQGLTYPEVIDAMYHLEEEIRNTGVNAYSIADELKQVNEILNRSKIIEKLAELANIDKIIFDKIAETGLINSDYSKTLIVVSVPASRSISETQTLVEKINLIISKAEIPYNGRLSKLIGQDVITVEINKQLMKSQVSSLIVALLLVLTCLIIGFNSTRIGFLAMLPVLFLLAWEPGTLVSLNIPMSVINITVASIMLGTGIDYSIQTTQRVREEIEKGSSKIDAVKTSIETSGLSIIGAAITTSVALVSTFLVPIPTLHQFSIVVISLITFSFFASKTVLPTILTTRNLKQTI
ncbi:MAG: MMPL family transporter, partial [Candidatus Thermoplasmatota archaeon]|nr:MMPL family transporter [Candidatus Thermoplasmatota archaeon]